MVYTFISVGTKPSGTMAVARGLYSYSYVLVPVLLPGGFNASENDALMISSKVTLAGLKLTPGNLRSYRNQQKHNESQDRF